MSTVPIPVWDSRGLMPTVDPIKPTAPNRSPYEVSVLDFTTKFGSSSERTAILRGWLEHRAALHRLGYTSGFQWVDGSFLENIERHGNRAPNDIDVVSFVELSGQSAPLQGDDEALDQAAAKLRFRVDAYFVELNLPPRLLVSQTAYWYSLWAHTRDQHWKGFVQIDLRPDDEAAIDWLSNDPFSDTSSQSP
jgi:hypothetical protein